jgi:hypothetical protein
VQKALNAKLDKEKKDKLEKEFRAQSNNVAVEI